MLQVDYGRGTKAAGYYVQYPSGLFPAPLPQTDYERMAYVEMLFRCIGTLFAKCIQDGRLVDIPLSRPLLKLMCGGDMTGAVSHTRSCSSVCVSRSSDDDLTPTEPMVTPPMNPWYDFSQNTLHFFQHIAVHTCRYFNTQCSCVWSLVARLSVGHRNVNG